MTLPRRSARPDAAPQDRSAISSRQRILDAATRLFARKGYDGVSVDAIVQEAGINKRMVYHYFGSKSGLYAAVLEGAFRDLESVETRLFQDQPPAEIAIERLVHAYFRFLLENPHFHALLAWENLQGGKHLAALNLTKAPLLDALSDAIRAGIDSGRLRGDLDPRHMLIHLIGTCTIYFSNRHTLSRSVGLSLDDPAVMEEGIRQAISLLRHGFYRE